MGGGKSRLFEFGGCVWGCGAMEEWEGWLVLFWGDAGGSRFSMGVTGSPPVELGGVPWGIELLFGLLLPTTSLVWPPNSPHLPPSLSLGWPPPAPLGPKSLVWFWFGRGNSLPPSRSLSLSLSLKAGTKSLFSGPILVGPSLPEP